jgi:hypothetical protein
MKNILIHHNNGEPVSIALSDEMTFNVIHRGHSMSKHQSVIAAIESATKEVIGSNLIVRSDWSIAGG